MKMLLAFAAAALVAAPAAAATNLGFETGDTSGWTASPNAFAATGFGPFSAHDGDFFGVAASGNGANVYATLSQKVYLRAGVTISGFVGFYGNDYLPFDDDGYLSINGTHLFDASVGSVGQDGNTGWVPFSFTAPVSGRYNLEIGGRNVADNCCNPSGTVIDSVSVTASVPEPASWVMLIAGFGLVGAAARRRQTAITA